MRRIRSQATLKMIKDREEKERFPFSNPEGNAEIINKKTTSGSNSRLWSSNLKDSRIVRVSKAFGGKDRHSKVCTVRGLRDRRVRLSVPTAIQLYDLQDRLGLNQPSKVVDWLLNAAQHEINKLPPLEYPFENFIQPHQSSEQASKENSTTYNPDHQCFDIVEEHNVLQVESPALMFQDVGIYNAQSSFHQDHNLLSNNSRGGGDQLDLGLISNNIGSFPYASFYQWDHQSNRNYLLSQLEIISSQVDVAPASVFSSYTTSTVPCELEGISTQQNLPLNSNAIFRNSFSLSYSNS